jgi:hypothetical protein
MRNCPELAAEIKQRWEQCKTKKNVNLNAVKADKGSFVDDEDKEDIDNFEDEHDLSDNLAANILEVNLATSKIQEQDQTILGIHQASWYLDSGASLHMFGERGLLGDLQ